MERCGLPAVKFFVATYDDAMLPIILHPRCPDHWETTSLPISPYVREVSSDEFAVYRVMLS
jgi:hypothetical protein